MGSPDELFDIYDEQMNRIGTATRREAHAKGLWHRTFQCWLWQRTPMGDMFLFQLRHAGKDTFPGLLDISSAGHLLAGEGVEDGVRELEEELGLAVPFAALTPCGVFAEEDVISPQLIDREFCHVYLYRCDRPLDGFALQADEVSGLYLVPVSFVRGLAAGDVRGGRFEGVRADAQGRLVSDTIEGGPGLFVPHPPAYYRMLLAAWAGNSEN